MPKKGQAGHVPEGPKTDAKPDEGPPSIGVDADAARIILKADLRNITRKVQLGRSLSSAERKMFASVAGVQAPPSAFVKTQVELADALGVPRKSIQRWRKIPGSPPPEADGRWNVAAWRAFKATRAGEDSTGGFETAAELKARLSRLQIKKLEHQIAVMRREYVPAAEVERWGAELGAAIRKVVREIHIAASSIVGMTVADAEVRLKEIEDDIISQLHLLDEAAASYSPKDTDE